MVGGTCSFCGKPGRVIASRISPALICDECIGLCIALRDEPPRGSAPPRDANGNPPTSAFRCSFCGQPRSETNKLISGPRVFICSHCAGDAADLLA